MGAGRREEGATAPSDNPALGEKPTSGRAWHFDRHQGPRHGRRRLGPSEAAVVSVFLGLNGAISLRDDRGGSVSAGEAGGDWTQPSWLLLQAVPSAGLLAAVGTCASCC